MMRSGLEVFLAEHAPRWRGRRVGLCCNHTAVDRHLEHAIDLLLAAGVRVERLFGPEHGVRATAQDMIGVDEVRDPVSGLPVVSWYGHDAQSLRPTRAHLDGLDAVLFDIQDIGARFYTYQATLAYLLEVAGPMGVEVVVLDRPNPIGGLAVEGNRVHPGFESFVGATPMAVRHGMTMGELAAWFQRFQGLEGPLTVVPCEGWTRGQWFEDTGLPWVYPSPNMPTVDTAAIYPGMCLFEATTWSEGRGTTRPFHLIGAPGVDPTALVVEARRVAAAAGLAGVAFRPAAFEPGFQKHRGEDCTGLEVHLTDRRQLDAFLLGLVLIEAAWRVGGDRFGWRAQPYEFIGDVNAFDLLTGSSLARETLEAGGSPWTCRAAWEPELRAFEDERRAVLRYPAR